MTAAQPNDMTHLAGTIGDEAAAERAGREAEAPPKYVGDMPDDPDAARSHQPGDDEADDPGRGAD
jgi:hypothetical protein